MVWIKNDSGADKTWVGQLLADQEYYNIQSGERFLWANDSAILSDIGNGDAVVSKDDSGNTDIVGVSDAINYLKDIAAVDPDTGAPLVSTVKLPTGWQFQHREMEFKTSEIGSVHDKDKFQVDLGESTLKFYEAGDVEITGGNLNQTYLDANCVRTDFSWQPTYAWGIRGAYCSQIQPPSQALYVWTDVMVLVDPAPVYLTLPMGEGGFNLEFVDARGKVGVNEDNFTFLSANDYVTWIFRHSTGLNHRIQCVLEIGKPI